MTELESAVVAALRAEAEEAAMSTDTPHEQKILDTRLDDLDRRTRNRRIVWTIVAAAAAVVVVAVGARALVRAPQAAAPAAPPPLFSSSTFGVPFTVESLPSWLTTQSLTPTSESLEWVTWNRCPDNATECIGLSFNRYGEVQGATSRTPVTYTSYVAYLDQLGSSGQVSISARKETTVDGRNAVVYDITAPKEVLAGVGCHTLGAAECDDFFDGVPGRYAVIDTGDLDPAGAVLNVWTRAGGIGPAEVGWTEQFDTMLASLRFTKPAPSSPTG
jgi:hypothetical protein